MRIFLVLAFLLLTIGCLLDSDSNYPNSDGRIKLEKLSRNLDQFHGKEIETEGVFWFEFENVSICPNYKEVVDCYWVDFRDENPDLTLDSLVQLSGKNVVIKGIVDAKRHGHMGYYTGTIKDVTYIALKK